MDGRAQTQHINVSIVDFSADRARMARDVSTEPKSLVDTKISILASKPDEVNSEEYMEQEMLRAPKQRVKTRDLPIDLA